MGTLIRRLLEKLLGVVVIKTNCIPVEINGGSFRVSLTPDIDRGRAVAIPGRFYQIERVNPDGTRSYVPRVKRLTFDVSADGYGVLTVVVRDHIPVEKVS